MSNIYTCPTYPNVRHIYMFNIYTCSTYMHVKNKSPGLWPMACQILDFLPFFTSSLPPFLLSSILPFFRCFWDLSGAYCGGRQGAIPRPTTRSFPCRTILQLRLKIALFFDAVFLPFWVDLGSQDGSKILPNPSKIDFEIALDFQPVFDTTF